MGTNVIAEAEHLGAGILWVGSIHAISRLTDFLMDIGTKSLTLLSYSDKKNYTNPSISSHWERFLYWLRRWACCKSGSIYLRDKNMLGVRPGAVNEIAIMSYYHFAYPKELQFFPFAPSINTLSLDWKKLPNIDKSRRSFVNMTEFFIGGLHAGASTIGLNGEIADPGGYGQLASRNTISKLNLAHLVGRFVSLSGCTVQFGCSNPIVLFNGTSSSSSSCWTVPFLKCESYKVPIFNLKIPRHDHSHKYNSM